MADNPILKALRRPSLLSQAQPVRPVEEEVDASLWESLGTSALSGISRVANLIDLPGSAVRDVIGGENPFDQFLPWNWTTSENRLSGRDLLRRGGLVSGEDTWGNFFGGMAAEIALDPATFVSGGALLKGAAAGLRGGKTAAKAGSGLLKFSIPLVKESATELFTGPAAQKTAGALGAAARGVGESRPMLAFNQLFDAAVAGMPTAITQRQARTMSEELAKSTADIQGVGQGFARELETAGLESPPKPLNTWAEKSVDGLFVASENFDILPSGPGAFSLIDTRGEYGEIAEFASIDEAKQAADDITLRSRENRYGYLNLSDDEVVRQFEQLPANKISEGVSLTETTAARERVQRFTEDLPNLRSGASTVSEFLTRHYGKADAADYLYSLPTLRYAVEDALKIDPATFGDNGLEQLARQFPEVRREFAAGLTNLAEHLNTIHEPLVREAEAQEGLASLRDELIQLAEAGEFEPWAPPESSWMRGIQAKSPEAGRELLRQAERPDLPKGELAKHMRQALDADLSQNEHWGIPANELRDPVKGGMLGYISRWLNPKLVEEMKGKRGLLPSSARRIMGGKDAGDVARSQTFKGFDDGTNGVNRLFAHKPLAEVLDPIRKKFQVEKSVSNATSETLNNIRDEGIAKGADQIQSDFGGEIRRHYQPERTDGAKLYLNNGRQEWHMPSEASGMTPVVNDRYKELAEIAFDHPSWLEHEVFNMHPIVSVEQTLLSSANKRAAAKMIYRTIAEAALDPVRALDTGTPTRELKDIIQSLEFKQDTAVERIAEMLGVGTLDAAKRREILRMRIPEAEAEAMLTAWPTYRLPKESGLLLDTVDSMNSLFKAGVLTWPARFVRDAVSGQVRNLENGWLTTRGFVDAHNLLQGRTVKGYLQSQPVIDWLNSKQLAHTEENATEALRRMYAQYRGHLSHPEMDLLDQTQNVDPGLESILERIPGRHEVGEVRSARDVLSAAAARAPGTSWNPFQVRGVMGAKRSNFGPAVAGDMVGQYVDNLNRLTPFLYKVGELGQDPAQAMAEIMRAQVNYSPTQFTSFEKSVMKRIFPFYCVPTTHECLTRGGWRTHDQISVGDEVMGFDPHTRQLRWTKVTAVNVFDFDGELNQLSRRSKGRFYRFLYTDNHRWPAQRVDHAYLVSDRKRIKIKGRVEFVEGADLKSGDSLFCKGQFMGVESILPPRLAAILGWVVTDGYHRWKGNSLEMLVYQSPGKFLDEIVSLLGRQPRKPHPDTGVCAVPVSLEDINDLKKVFKSKADLPRIVCHLSREAAEAMWDAMFKAEGSNGKHFAQCQAKGKYVTEAFQILCTMTGRCAAVSSLGCYLRGRDTYQFTRRRHSRVHYTGKVWCPTTEMGTWVMRHDGQVVMTGNSFMKSQLPYLATELLDKPGGRLRQEIRFMSALRGEDPSVPDYIGNTASIPLGSLPDGSKRYLTGLGLMHEDPLGFVDSPQGIGLELLSRTNPFIKAPLEFATGQSFFQRGIEGGRALEDLDPVLGRTLANIGTYFGRTSDQPIRTPQLLELAVSNSPLARAATTARTLTDPRKGFGARALNTLSGFRVSDVSPAAQERALERQAAAEILRRGGRTFERPYFPEDRLEGMSGPQQQLAQKLLELEQIINERRQARSRASAQ